MSDLIQSNYRADSAGQVSKLLTSACAICPRAAFFRVMIALLLSVPVAASDYNAKGAVSLWGRFCTKILNARPATALTTKWREQDAEAWSNLKDDILSEVAQFQNLAPVDQKDYLARTSEELEAKIVKKFGHRRIGFHYNLHGGLRENYETEGGIHAQVSGAGSEIGLVPDLTRKVFFFNLEKTSIEQILSTRNPQVLYPKSRMGNVLLVFDLDHPSLLRARQEGVITQVADIFMGFDEKISREKSIFFGVPKEAYLVRPLAMFNIKAKDLQLRRMSWDDETLVALRLLEYELTTTAAPKVGLSTINANLAAQD